MKNLIIILLLSIGVASSCKKEKVTTKLENSTWEVSQIVLNDEDKTEEVLKTKIVYTRLEYTSASSSFTYLNPTRGSVEDTEEGDWNLEKIVPTVGKNYYLVRNTLPFSQKRKEVFNLNEYGSNLKITEDYILTQTIEDYTIIYEKVN